MSSVGSVRFTGLFPDIIEHITVYSFSSTIKKGAEAPLVQRVTTRLSAGGTVDT